MPVVMMVWVASLVTEFGVLAEIARSVWRRTYPRFFTYLLFDWTASLLLFWVTTFHTGLYDLIWRIVQVCLLFGRLGLVLEAYQHMAKTNERWRFSDGTVFPLAGFAVLILQEAMVRPAIWPHSSLEAIFALMGGGNAFLGFVLVGFFSIHRGQTGGGATNMELYHGKILCGYLLFTAPCYYAASQHIDSIGVALMLISVVCYLSWFACLWIDSRQPRDLQVQVPGKE